jgi:anti-sigma B factor antagonist
MRIEVAQQDGVRVAALHGVIEDDYREAFERQLHPLIEEHRGRVVLDLSDVPRITSSGLGLLVTLVARANTKGATVILAAAQPFIESVLNVTRLDQFFTVTPTVAEAIKRLIA